MALARRSRERGIDYWPGFVDALSTLVLGIVFLLSVFVVVQFFLSQEVTGKDNALARLNAQIAQLTDMLSLEKVGKANLEDKLAPLRAGLALPDENERDRVKGVKTGLRGGRQHAQATASSTGARLAESAIVARAWRRWSCSTSRSARCAASSARSRRRSRPPRSTDKESRARIADLGQRLNVALAQRVQELSRYRSEFFGRLRADSRQSAGHPRRRRPLRVPVGSAVRRRAGRACPKASAELDKLAEALLDLDTRDPDRHRLGAARRRPHRRAADHQRGSSRRTGSCPPRARSRWCST